MSVSSHIEGALRSSFPLIDLRVTEKAHSLFASFVVNDKRYEISTPPAIPCESCEPEWWISRFADEIKRKLGP